MKVKGHTETGYPVAPTLLVLFLQKELDNRLELIEANRKRLLQLQMRKNGCSAHSLLEGLPLHARDVIAADEALGSKRHFTSVESMR